MIKHYHWHESCHYLDFDLDLTMLSMSSLQWVSVIPFCHFHPSSRYSSGRLVSPTAWASTAGFKSSSFATRTVLIGLRYGNAWRQRSTLILHYIHNLLISVSTERTKICQRGRKSRQCLLSKMQREGEKRRYRRFDKGIERTMCRIDDAPGMNSQGLSNMIKTAHWWFGEQESDNKWRSIGTALVCITESVSYLCYVSYVCVMNTHQVMSVLWFCSRWRLFAVMYQKPLKACVKSITWQLMSNIDIV